MQQQVIWFAYVWCACSARRASLIISMTCGLVLALSYFRDMLHGDDAAFSESDFGEDSGVDDYCSDSSDDIDWDPDRERLLRTLRQTGESSWRPPPTYERSKSLAERCGMPRPLHILLLTMCVPRPFLLQARRVARIARAKEAG